MKRLALAAALLLAPPAAAGPIPDGGWVLLDDLYPAMRDGRVAPGLTHLQVQGEKAKVSFGTGDILPKGYCGDAPCRVANDAMTLALTTGEGGRLRVSGVEKAPAEATSDDPATDASVRDAVLLAMLEGAAVEASRSTLTLTTPEGDAYRFHRLSRGHAEAIDVLVGGQQVRQPMDTLLCVAEALAPLVQGEAPADEEAAALLRDRLRARRHYEFENAVHEQEEGPSDEEAMEADRRAILATFSLDLADVLADGETPDLRVTAEDSGLLEPDDPASVAWFEANVAPQRDDLMAAARWFARASAIDESEIDEAMCADATLRDVEPIPDGGYVVLGDVLTEGVDRGEVGPVAVHVTASGGRLGFTFVTPFAAEDALCEAQGTCSRLHEAALLTTERDRNRLAVKGRSVRIMGTISRSEADEEWIVEPTLSFFDGAEVTREGGGGSLIVEALDGRTARMIPATRELVVAAQDFSLLPELSLRTLDGCVMRQVAEVEASGDTSPRASALLAAVNAARANAVLRDQSGDANASGPERGSGAWRASRASMLRRMATAPGMAPENDGAMLTEALDAKLRDELGEEYEPVRSLAFDVVKRDLIALRRWLARLEAARATTGSDAALRDRLCEDVTLGG